jgi:hypothetical protein
MIAPPSARSFGGAYYQRRLRASKPSQRELGLFNERVLKKNGTHG